MNKKLLFASILTVVTLSACSVSQDNTYLRNEYSDVKFENNYYRIKEENILNNISSSNSYMLDKTNDSVFTSYNELKALNLDKDVNNGTVEYDSVTHFNGKTTFGKNKCLGKIDDSFNHGMLSKLTDGLMFCDATTYQGVRVQIDETGFVHEYDKACVSADYFALSFKAGDDYTNPLRDNVADFDIRINIKFYIKDGDKFKENICSYELDNIRRDSYYLFGFELKRDMAYNLKGLGISYDLLNSSESSEVSNCLLLYETLFVNSSWY